MLKNNLYLAFAINCCLVLNFNAYDSGNKDDHSVTIEVTATAYNTTEFQTKKGNDGIAAWGDTLVPGEKAIAVSRDLIIRGLTHNKVVKIEGLEGEYMVKDKMNKRYTKSIDIYMGQDVKAAKAWGRQKVKITFDTINNNT